MRTLSNVWKLYAIRIFYNLIPAYVIERLFWEQRGMTIQMVVYTEIIFAVTVVLLEIPTGILADKWGRKHMLVLAGLLGCCEFAILLAASEFWHFALVVVLAAIGSSASSGAESALLYDSLASAGQERHFEKYVGRLNALDIVSIMLAALAGSWLASRCGYELNYWISLGAAAVSFGLTFLLAEPAVRSFAESGESSPPVRAYVTSSIRFFARNPGVCLVMLSGMTAGAAMDLIDEFWQIYLDRLDIPVVSFGLFSAAFFLLRLPGNLVAYRLRTRFSERTLLWAALAAMTAGFAYIAAIPSRSGLAAMMVICLAAGVIQPLAAGYLQHRADPAMRATLGSFQSLGENALLTLAGLGFGYFSAKGDIFGGYGFTAALCGACLAFFLLASATASVRRR